MNKLFDESMAAVDAKSLPDVKAINALAIRAKATEARNTSLINALQAVCSELATYTGKNAMVRPGCLIGYTMLAHAVVLLEYEYSPASGDGVNEPREQSSVQVLNALINGMWIDASYVFNNDQLDEIAAKLLAEYEAGV